MNVTKITEILKKFCNDELTVEEAADMIKGADPLDLSLAEMDLMSEGFEQKDLKDITEIFLKVIEEKKEEYKDSVDKGHPIRDFISDHEKILERMDRIEEILNGEGELKYGEKEYIKKIFPEFEKHHKREEETILPFLEKNGKRGRVNLVKNEHEEIRRKEERIEDLLDGGDPSSIREEVQELRYLLNNHTIMENNYLYPVAIERIDDWGTITRRLEDMAEIDLPKILRSKGRN